MKNTKQNLFYKTLVITLFISILTLTACTSNSKYYRPDPEMPDEARQEHEEALSQALEALEENEGATNPKDAENFDAIMMLEAGFRHQMLGEYADAIEYYEDLLEYDPVHWVALNNLADIYEQVEEYDKAAEYIKRLYQSDPDSERVLIDTVRILIKAKAFVNAVEAIDNFEKLVIKEGMELELEQHYRNLMKELRDDVDGA